MSLVTKVLNRVAPRPVGRLTDENEARTAEEALAVLSKEARKTLNEVGQWKQEFHGNEIVACMAMLIATNKALKEEISK